MPMKGLILKGQIKIIVLPKKDLNLIKAILIGCLRYTYLAIQFWIDIARENAVGLECLFSHLDTVTRLTPIICANSCIFR